MNGSKDRVRRVLSGQRPDRIPLFDLIPNDAVLQYFNHGLPVAPGDDAAGIRALAAATDATRCSYFSPMAPKTEALPDGRTRKYERWTIWTEARTFASSEDYQKVKAQELAREREEIQTPLAMDQDGLYIKMRDVHSLFDDDYYFVLSSHTPGLMGIYGEVGLEAFSYYFCDCEETIVEQLEVNTDRACRWARALPADHSFEMVFLGDDIAFNKGPMVAPAWLRRNYFPQLRRLVDVYHERGMKIMFHSDGNLNPIMDDLVAAGIDVLNPIEVAAGMDLADLHRRYPRLIFAGGIDVSGLLPFGKPAEVKDAVVRAIEDTDGQILVGSSTEVVDCVPLENYLALRQAVLEYRL